MAASWSDSEWLNLFQNLYFIFSIGAVVLGALALGATFGRFSYSDRINKAQAEQVAKAHERTLQLELELEQARLRHAELQAIVQPRDLTADQQQALTDACHRFSGRTVTLDVNRVDLEGFLLGQLVKESLERAGVRVAFDPQKGPTIDGFDSGVRIYQPTRNDKDLGKALRQSLSDFGLVVKDAKPDHPDEPGAIIRISVGVRPFRAEGTQPSR